MSSTDQPADPADYLPPLARVKATVQLKQVQDSDRTLWVLETVQEVTDAILTAREHGGLVGLQRVKGDKVVEFTFDPSAFLAVEEA